MKLTGEDKRAFGVGASVFALLALLLAFGALWVAGSAMNKSEDAEQAAAVGGSGLKVTLTEFKLDPASVNAEEGATLAVTNAGTVEHDLTVKGTDKRAKMLKPGESDTIDLSGVKPGQYTIFCSVPGHEAAGMTGTLVLGRAGAAAAPESGTAGASDAVLRATNDADDRRMKEVVDTYVAQLENGPNTKGVGNQPLSPTVLADGTKEFRVSARVVD